MDTTPTPTPKATLPPAMGSRRRTRAIRQLAKGQITTNLAFEAFVTRNFWGRLLWLLFGR